ARLGALDGVLAARLPVGALRRRGRSGRLLVGDLANADGERADVVAKLADALAVGRNLRVAAQQIAVEPAELVIRAPSLLFVGRRGLAWAARASAGRRRASGQHDEHDREASDHGAS